MAIENQEAFNCEEDGVYRIYCDICDNLCRDWF